MHKILFINPWVNDFSCFNLWSAPLGLYEVISYFSQFDAKLQFIDCLDADERVKADGRSHIRKERIEKPQAYKNIPRFYYRFGISKDEFKKMVHEEAPFDVVLMSSGMTYWYKGVKETIDFLREELPGIPIVLGGIYPTLCPEHAMKTTGPDFIFKGPISEKVLHILKETGINLRKKHPQKDWFDFIKLKNFAPLKTSYGCPFNCTYCATPVLNGRFNQRPVDDVLSEIDKLYSKGIRNFAFYDDALLCNAEKHIVPILRQTIEHFSKARFFTPVGLHSRMISEETAFLMKQANFDYLRIGYETKNLERQKETGGKITDTDLEAGISNLKKANFKGKDIGIFTMYGLPNQSLSEVSESINYLKSLKVKIILTEYSPVSGTTEASKIDPKIVEEPLLTNNTAYSSLFCDYNSDDLKRLKLDVKSYNEALTCEK